MRMLFATMATFGLTFAAHAGVIVVPPTAVPEPATLTLLAVGVGAAALYRRSRR